IFPFQENADAFFNSATIYELAVLKTYAEPVLFDVPEDTEEYITAKRMIKFLDYFLGVPADAIPQTSIVKEFIGGGLI
ncbi:MAG: nucleoside kinase, partial [Firmicutes bacterium]|nr:nucleoside kinase [Bacillota bacterium]